MLLQPIRLYLSFQFQEQSIQLLLITFCYMCKLWINNFRNFNTNSGLKKQLSKMAKRPICLFDIDGTLTKPRNDIEQSMIDCLKKLTHYADIGLVGGSDKKKILEQIGQQTVNLSNYFFSQNGLIAYEQGQLIGTQSINEYLSEQKLKRFINFCLKYLAQIDIPIKRGTFIEYRTGMINISPIGRNCSQKQRDDFQVYDRQHEIRKKFIKVLKQEFADFNMTYSIGGQISFDVMPKGWDKTYCLRFLKNYDEIYFFGDKTYEGGNDHQIYEAIKPSGKAYSVSKGPSETIELLEKLFIHKAL